MIRFIFPANNMITKLTSFLIKFRYLVTLGFLVTGYFGLISLKQLQLDPSLSSLLKSGHPVIANLNKVTEYYGGIGSLIVIIRSKEIEVGEKITNALVKKLQDNPLVRYIDYKKPKEYVRQNLLLYLEPADLEKFHSRLYNKLEYERQKNNQVSNIFGLMEDEIKDPGLYTKDILEKYEAMANIDLDKAEDRDTSEFFYRLDKAASHPHSYVLLIKPVQSSVDVRFSREIIAEVDGLIEGLKVSFADIDIQHEFTGRYKKKIDTIDRLAADMSKVSLISLGSILFILMLYFRNIGAVIILFIALFLGLILTFFTTLLAFGKLNLVTSMLAAILFGLGIDFGIHYLTRFLEERHSGRSMQESIEQMLRFTGKASLTSAITTSAAFFLLMSSDFRAFYEFGFIAAVGVLSIFLSMTLFLPSALALFSSSSFLEKNNALKMPFPVFLFKKPIYIARAYGIFILLAFIGIYNVSFDYDFSKLTSFNDIASYDADREVNDMFDFSLTPSVIFANSVDEEKLIVTKINDYKKSYAGNEKLRIHHVVALSSFIPQYQEQNFPILKRIDRTLRRFQKFRPEMDKDTRQKYDALKSAIPSQTISEDFLPPILKNNLKPIEKYRDKRVILVFPEADLSKGKEVLAFAGQINEIQIKNKPPSMASDSLIFAEVIRLIHDEGYITLTLCFSAILLFLLLNFRSFKDTAIISLPLAVALVTVGGTMGIIGLKIDFFNVIMFPILLGIGIDNGVHLYSRYKETGDIMESLATTGEAVTLSSITTFCGFGALAFSDSAGVASIGMLAILGILLVYLGFMLLLPSMILLIKPNK
jgi:uncharacterized protein